MFAASYGEARRAFRVEAAAAGARLEALAVVEAAADGEPLTIDAAILGTGPRALVLSSGLHGVEGFAGSAIQRQLLAGCVPGDLRVVLLHALNPHGMAHLRRVNENNVDLNRNFLAPGEAYFEPARSYRRFHPLLNPETPPRFELFLPRALLLIARHGMPALKQGIVGGQYEFPRGLFFGGERLERGPALLLEALPRWLEGVEHAVHVDFHTGLGRSGSYALLVEADAGSAHDRRMRETYGDRVQPWAAGEGVAYRIRGGFPSALNRLFGERIEVLTCEFGTKPGLAVLRALRLENRVHHWGGDATRAKAALLEAFAPRSPRWRARVLAGGRAVIGQAVEALRRRGAVAP